MKYFRLVILILILAGLYLFRAEVIERVKPLIVKIPLSEEVQKFIGLDQVESSKSDKISKTKASEKEISLPGPLAQLIGKEPAPTQKLSYEKIIEATNQERIKYGLKPLSEKGTLNSSALFKAYDMDNLQYFEHESPSGKNISDLAEQFGYEYITIGENLAMGNFESEAAMVEAWMNSPGHRANILNPKYTQIGIGLVPGAWQGRRVWYGVQHFGKPLTDCPSIDKALKAIVTKNQTEITNTQKQLAIQKTEIEKAGTGNQNYPTLVKAYNELVNKYNTLINETKSKVSTYNEQVKAFNACIQ